MRVPAIVTTAVTAFALACGGSTPVKPIIIEQPEPKPPLAHRSPPPRKVVKKIAKEVEPPRPAELPRGCSGTSKPCFPPADFVRLLCRKKYPGVALAMFEKSAPWQHVFVKVADVAPINSLGGPAGDARLEFLEEVLVLRLRDAQHYEDIQMDMPKSYDVLRFDGTCATLAEDEFMWHRPVVRARYAPIVWEHLDSGMRQVLSQNERIERARESQTQACRGSYLAGGGSQCKEATQKLAHAIVSALSRGISLPNPERLPQWPANSASGEQSASRPE